MMTVESYKELHWKEQNAFMEPHVLAIRQTMAEPWPTKRLMLAMADRIGWLDDSLGFLPGAGQALAVVLRRFQEHKPGWALHNGPEFEFVGRTYRRWMWQPAKAEETNYDPFA